MQHSHRTINKDADKLDISVLFNRLISSWYWLLFGLFVGVVLALIFNRYNAEQYAADATLKIESGAGGISSIMPLDLYGSGKEEALAEVEIIHSRTLIQRALSNIPIQVSYFKRELLAKREIYKKAPFIVDFAQLDTLAHDYTFDIDFSDAQSFTLHCYSDDADYTQTATWSELITLGKFQLRIEPSVYPAPLNLEENKQFSFQWNEPLELLARFQDNLIVEEVNKSYTVIGVKYRDISPYLAQDFVNELCQEYIKQDVGQKTRVATQTLDFIQSQLEDLAGKVEVSEENMARFKRENEVLNIESKGLVEIQQLTEFEVQKRMLELRQLSLDVAKSQLEAEEQIAQPMVSVDGLSDDNLTEVINKLNDLQFQKSSLDLRFTEQSPLGKELQLRLDELKQAAKMNLQLAQEKIDERESYYNREIARLKTELGNVPESQRLYLNILRDFQVSESVYSFLLEKKLEASISKATVVSSARVIDAAILDVEPVSISGRKIIVLLGGMGFGIAALLIVLLRFFSKKIYDKETLEMISSLPIIGVVPKTKMAGPFIDLKDLGNNRSVFNESIRALRANLQFIGKGDGNKVVSVTSSVSGEGKTLISSGIAGVMAMLDKKVILLDLDMRKPKLHLAFNTNNHVGMSTILSGQTAFGEAIQRATDAPIDFITSGPVPPNPSELLQSPLFAAMIAELKEQYDLIVLDTPPVGLVSDSVPILKMSDAKLYVVRAGYSETDFLSIPENLVKDHELKNLYLVLNGYDSKKAGNGGTYASVYGGGYYSESETQGKGFSRWFGKK